MTSPLQDIIQKAAEIAKDPRRFTGYAKDPVGFARDILGIPLIDIPTLRTGLWSKQVEVFEAVRDHKWVAVKSGHGVSKTFSAAVLILWWVYACEGVAITTSQTWEQTEKVLWSQIGKLLRNAVVPLPGELLNTELRVEPGWAAYGLNAESPVAFQGKHHQKLMVIVDEAMGIAEPVWDAILSLVLGNECKLLAIANPTEAVGTFYDAFRDDDWFTLTISCLEHPNVLTGVEIIKGAVTKGWVENQRKRHPPGSPGWASRVEGNFPEAGSNQLIPLAWVEAAMREDKRAGLLRMAKARRVKPIFALDVARFGRNQSILAIREGGVIHPLIERQGMDTMELVGMVISAGMEWKPEAEIVDEPGVGGGVVDRLLEQSQPAVGFQGGGKASNPRQFRNLRSEVLWRLREKLQDEMLALPDDPDLKKQLTSYTYKYHSSGAIFVNSKDEDFDASPDKGDAVSMTLALDLPDEEQGPDPTDTKRDPTIIGQGAGYQSAMEVDGEELLGGFPVGF